MKIPLMKMLLSLCQMHAVHYWRNLSFYLFQDTLITKGLFADLTSYMVHRLLSRFFCSCSFFHILLRLNFYWMKRILLSRKALWIRVLIAIFFISISLLYWMFLWSEFIMKFLNLSSFSFRCFFIYFIYLKLFRFVECMFQA